jgi:protein GP2
MLNSNITYEPFFNICPIQTEKQRQLGCHTEILEGIEALFNCMLIKHNKVFFIRFDVRFPRHSAYPVDNKIFIGFIANFTKNLKRKKLDPHIIWVREKSLKTPQTPQHFHCLLLLNGSLTQSIYGHLAIAEELWNRALGLPAKKGNSLIWYCSVSSTGKLQQNGLKIIRESPDFYAQYRHCFHWATYMAKCNTKGNAPVGVREFGYTQLY